MTSLTKQCCKCNEIKDVKFFYISRLECKACVKKRTRNWRMTQTFRRYKKDKCENCGFIPMHSCQLDVDHIDGNHKNDDISNLRTLCANCHRLKTHLNNDRRRKFN